MTETKRLYYEDVYKKEFTAKVLECREAKKGFHIILDESAFYPEGGGQPCDTGALGTALGLPAHIVHRQPFPGPGLAIRIIGAVSPEKLEILKNADAIVREELDAYNERLFQETGERNSEHSCWQYFAVLPDIKSVGVMGDERTYQRPIILRAVESSDAMTADWAKLPYDVLAKISSRIVAEVPGANRVCYDITSKPPATIEWE